MHGAEISGVKIEPNMHACLPVLYVRPDTLALMCIIIFCSLSLLDIRGKCRWPRFLAHPFLYSLLLLTYTPLPRPTVNEFFYHLREKQHD